MIWNKILTFLHVKSKGKQTNQNSHDDERKKSDWSKIKEGIKAPFLVIRHCKHDFFLWLVYVIFAGLLGVIINVVKRWIFDGDGFQKALTFDSQAGSFYTFSLVICSSLIWPMFKSLKDNDEPKYSMIRTVLLTLLIFTDLFCAVFYAFSNINPHKWFWQICDDWYPLDIPQFLFFIFALILSVYSFGIPYLPKHPEYKVSDDHLKCENHRVEKLKSGLNSSEQTLSDTSQTENQEPFNI